MCSNVVAIKINKVQTFLYQAISVGIQERQTEDKTLKNILSSSCEISSVFFDRIKFFFGDDINYLLKISGKVIFCSVESAVVLKGKLQELFKEYYLKFKGQLPLQYVIFSKDNLSELDIIRKTDRLFKDKNCLNEIIRDNQELLFNFPDLPCESIKNMKRKYSGNGDDVSGFALNIDDLKLLNSPDDQKSFKIAVIKADLDEMKEFFQRQKDFDSYKKLSSTLQEKISFKNLSCLLNGNDKRYGSLKIFPLYLAGDDVFIAVDVNHIFEAVDLIVDLLKNINYEIRNLFGEDMTESLKISIGIDIATNDQPIRYYYERVEKQLENAKKKIFLKNPSDTVKCEQKPNWVKISFNNILFLYLEDYISNIKSQYLRWEYLKRDVKLLNYVREKSGNLIGVTNFFHQLLNILRNNQGKENEKKRAVDLLYYLHPQNLPSTLPDSLEQPFVSTENGKKKLYFSSLDDLVQAELLLKAVIIDRLLILTGNGKKKLSFSELDNFETFLRLMLFFSDERFFSKSLDISESNIMKKFSSKKINSILFNKTKYYIYDILSKHKELGKIFVEEIDDITCYKSKNGKNVKYYRKVKMSNSMIQKLKKVLNHWDIDRISAFLEKNSKIEIEEVDEREKPRYYKNLNASDIKCFKENFQKFTPGFLDALVIFHKYENAGALYKNMVYVEGD